MISIQNLSKRFGNRVIFENVNISLEPGHVYGLVGPNGCGKTTLLRCICGLVSPSTGKVIIDGKVIGKDTDFAPNTGIIIGTPGFLPYYSGLKNLQILAALSGKVDPMELPAAMKKFGLCAEDKTKVGKYSTGMLARLGWVQATMGDPDHVILDEPANGLDKSGVADMYNVIHHLKRQRKTILLVSHSPADIARVCDIVYEMENGQLTLLKEKAIPCSGMG